MNHIVRVVFLAILICQSLSPAMTLEGDSGVTDIKNAEPVESNNGMQLAESGSSTTKNSSVKQHVKKCVPECRSGYVCIDGACVEKCNPPCPKNSYCTENSECLPLEKTSAQFNDQTEKIEQPKTGSGARKNDDCFPECRYGYTCIGGKCVENCNPPCPNGYYCASGGTCLQLGQEEDRIVIRTEADKELYTTGHAFQIVLGTIFELVGVAATIGGVFNLYSYENLQRESSLQNGVIFSAIGLPVLAVGVTIQINGIIRQGKHKKWEQQQKKLSLLNYFLGPNLQLAFQGCNQYPVCK